MEQSTPAQLLAVKRLVERLPTANHQLGRGLGRGTLVEQSLETPRVLKTCLAQRARFQVLLVSGALLRRKFVVKIERKGTFEFLAVHNRRHFRPLSLLSQL